MYIYILYGVKTCSPPLPLCICTQTRGTLWNRRGAQKKKNKTGRAVGRG